MLFQCVDLKGQRFDLSTHVVDRLVFLFQRIVRKGHFVLQGSHSLGAKVEIDQEQRQDGTQCHGQRNDAEQPRLDDWSCFCRKLSFFAQWGHDLVL